MRHSRSEPFYCPLPNLILNFYLQHFYDQKQHHPCGCRNHDINRISPIVLRKSQLDFPARIRRIQPASIRVLGFLSA